MSLDISRDKDKSGEKYGNVSIAVVDLCMTLIIYTNITAF